MKRRLPLLVALVASAVAALPTATAAPASAQTWSREDPSFPFRWVPCQPIPYQVNLAGTSHRNLVALRDALGQISRATGFRFVYAGGSTALPYARGRSTLDQVPGHGLTVAWATPKTVPGLAGNVVGLGGPGVSYHRIGTEWQIDSGAVVIDKTARLTTAKVDGPSLRSLLLHELGHAMGLGHSPSKKDVMYEGLGPWSRPHLGPGDRAGLRDLGTSAACS